MILLNNQVTSTTPLVIDFDGRDKFAATKNVAVTRASWASGSNTLLAGAVEMYDTSLWGTDYRAPVGENIPDTETVSSSLIIYPTSDVAVGSWAEGVAGADADTFRFNEIDDPSGTPDDDTTFIVSSGTSNIRRARQCRPCRRTCTRTLCGQHCLASARWLIQLTNKFFSYSR